MKITKQRLKEIIKEELSGLGEGDRGDRDWASNPSNPLYAAEDDEAAGYASAHADLADIATRVGGSEFASAVSKAIVHATSTPDSLGGPEAMDMMAAALKTLTLSMQETDDPDEEDTPDEDEEEPLVLQGDPTPEQTAALRRKLKYGFEKWRK